MGQYLTKATISSPGAAYSAVNLVAGKHQERDGVIGRAACG
jgi:hypothetical protein